jgi:hypothetical protein
MGFSKVALLLLLGLLVAGCSVKNPVAEQGGLIGQEKQRVANLEQLFLSLDAHVDRGEAAELARSSVTYAYELAERYDLVWPPLLHNTLVNVGLREKGLCYQWADDMLAHVSDRAYRSFDFYLGVSEMGTYWEHNTLVVSAKGRGFEQGIVLDPWRDSGTLYFVRVGEDKKYRWSQRND